MKEEAISLIGTWQVNDKSEYLFSIIIACLIIRIIIAALKAMTSCKTYGGYFSEFWKCFSSIASQDESHTDYWHPFFLGIVELSAYPVLMVTNHWSFIGAWLAFKTIAQWKIWAEKRTTFNRFLIGNALTLFVSLLWLTHFVTIVV
ncbi:MAG: hypothetical protein ABSH16_08395 [Sedimentisphaerales bacterium]